MARIVLDTEEVIERIETYLAGKSPGQETAAWAVGVLTRRTFNASEKLMENALTALAGLHDDDERFDTAREDLVYFKNCLLAKVPYTVSLEFPARSTAEEQSPYEIEPEEATARELKPRRPSVQESGRRE